MNIKVKKITAKIFHLEFETRYECAATMLRVQEFYECPNPKFQGNIFSLEEYMDWYAKERGNFTYYSDWCGFNVPLSESLYLLKNANDLSKKESQLLTIIEEFPIPEDGYLVATSSERAYSHGDLKHEVAHGLWSTRSEYRQKVEEKLDSLPQEILIFAKNELIKQGYDERVVRDETHAYSLDSSTPLYFREASAESLTSLESNCNFEVGCILSDFHFALNAIFSEYCPELRGDESIQINTV